MKIASNILILMMLLFNQVCIGQQENLVINPSFEEHTHCPKMNEFDFACKDWSPAPNDYMSTPDYYHRCTNDSGVSVPYHYSGYCQPRTGDAYIGLVLIDIETTYMEHIQGHLKEPLVANHKYEVSFYVKFAYTYSDFSSYNIGAILSNTTKVISDVNYIPGLSEECTPSIAWKVGDCIKDTDWVKISGIYVSHGGEKYITIGLCWDNNHEIVKLYKEFDGQKIALGNTKFNKTLEKKMFCPNPLELKKFIRHKTLKNGDRFAYYYIDDVSVVEVK